VTLQDVKGSLLEDMEEGGEEEMHQTSLVNRNVVRVKPQSQFIQQVGEGKYIVLTSCISGVCHLRVIDCSLELF